MLTIYILLITCGEEKPSVRRANGLVQTGVP